MPGAEELQCKEIRLCCSAQSFRHHCSFGVLLPLLLPAPEHFMLSEPLQGLTFNRQPHFQISRPLNQMNQCKGNIFKIAKEMHRRDDYLVKKELQQETHLVMIEKVDQTAASWVWNYLDFKLYFAIHQIGLDSLNLLRLWSSPFHIYKLKKSFGGENHIQQASFEGHIVRFSLEAHHTMFVLWKNRLNSYNVKHSSIEGHASINSSISIFLYTASCLWTTGISVLIPLWKPKSRY